jgi:WD40 repeat protein
MILKKLILLCTISILFLISTVSCDSAREIQSNHAPIRQLSAHQDPIWSIVFTPSGDRFATASADGTIRIWDTETFDLLEQLEGHSGWVMSLDFSPNGGAIVSGDLEGSIKTWSVSGWSETAAFDGHSELISDLTFSPDGSEIVSASFDRKVLFWNVQEGTKTKEFVFEAKYVNAIDIDPSGNLLVVALYGDSPKDIRSDLVDLRSGKVIDSIYGHIPFSIAFSTRVPNGPGREIADGLLESGDFSGGVTDIQFIHDGRDVVTVGDDGYLIVANAMNGDIILRIEAHNLQISKLAISPDETMVATAAGGEVVRIHDLNDGQLLFEFGDHPVVVKALAFSPDGTSLFSGSHDGRVRVLELSR